MFKLFFIIALSIIAVTQFVLEVIEMHDRKRGIKVNYRDYTILGMLKLIRQENKKNRRERKAAKQGNAEKNLKEIK